MKMKQLLVKIMLVGHLVLGSTVVMAQIPSDSSLTQLAKISDFENDFLDGMKQGFIQSFTQGILNNPNIQQLPAPKKAKVEKLAEEMGNKVLKDIATVDLSKKMLDDFLIIAKQHYTQQEVDAMIEFYSTPIVKSILSNQAIKTVENDKNSLQIVKTSVEKHYTQQEVDAMIEFYSTPIGKSIVSKQNIVMMEFSNQAVKMVENDKNFLQTVETSVEKHLPDFAKQLESVLKK